MVSLASIRAAGEVYSHSIVPGGFEVMSKTTRFTPFTSLTILVAILCRSAGGSFAQSAVIPSSDSTARIAMVEAYVRASPITPTLETGSKTAKACHKRVPSPAASTSSLTMASAFRTISNRSSVTSPTIRTANPGPGNGCRFTSRSSKPNSRPTSSECKQITLCFPTSTLTAISRIIFSIGYQRSGLRVTLQNSHPLQQPLPNSTKPLIDGCTMSGISSSLGASLAETS